MTNTSGELEYLRELATTIQSRINDIEAGNLDLLPEGDYEAIITSIDRCVTEHHSRVYWKFEFKVTSGRYKDRCVYRNYVEQQPTELEQVARKLGVNLQRPDVAEWINGLSPIHLGGKACVISIIHKKYTDRVHSEVARIRPHD